MREKTRFRKNISSNCTKTSLVIKRQSSTLAVLNGISNAIALGSVTYATRLAVFFVGFSQVKRSEQRTINYLGYEVLHALQRGVLPRSKLNGSFRLVSAY